MVFARSLFIVIILFGALEIKAQTLLRLSGRVSSTFTLKALEGGEHGAYRVETNHPFLTVSYINKKGERIIISAQELSRLIPKNKTTVTITAH